MQLESVARRAHEFDVIHCHLDYFGYPLLRRLGTPRHHVARAAGSARASGPVRVVRGHAGGLDLRLARVPLPEANYVATVLHGLPRSLLAKGPGRGGYLAFLGASRRRKAPDAAIRIAARAGIPLKIAAKVDRVDEEYFKTQVEPLLSLGQVEFIGESARIRSRSFWATRPACCSRSRGASRSGW